MTEEILLTETIAGRCRRHDEFPCWKEEYEPFVGQWLELVFRVGRTTMLRGSGEVPYVKLPTKALTPSTTTTLTIKPL